MNETATLPFAGTTRRPSDNHAARRWGAMIGGGALAVYGLSRRSALGVLLAASGGALAYTGFRLNSSPRHAVAHSSVLLNCSPEQAFGFWRDFENLPRFMRHLESVSVSDSRHSRWIALGPMGMRVAWNAEIVEERENEFIAWRSLPGSDIAVDGRVEFRKAPAGRGTIVSVVVQYSSVAGVGTSFLAKVFGKDPSFLMLQDLRRMKALIEAGEVPTVEGQSHGPRSLAAGAARLLDPDRPVRWGSDIGEVLKAQRRIS